MNDARASRQGGSEGHRAGVANGQAVRAARANYGAIISAELNRHKFYPAGARARGKLALSASPSPSAARAALPAIQSSAHPAHQRSMALLFDDGFSPCPSPPGGSFHGNIIINFNLSH